MTLETPPSEQFENLVNDDEGNYTSFGVILGRDLIFLDWTVNFGGQILGLILGLILGFIFGAKMGTLFNAESPVSVGAYIALQTGILLSVTGLTLYYTTKLGIKLNSPRKIAKNKFSLAKAFMFGLSAIFGLAYLFNRFIFPYIYSNFSSISPTEPGEPGQNGGTDGNQGSTIDLATVNQYILLLVLIFLVVAAFAILYSGLIYSFNKKANTRLGVAIMVSTLMLSFTLLTQSQSIQKLLDGEVMAFLTDFFYFFLVASVTVIVYHISRRIELSIVVLFIGFAFGFGAPSNVISQIIALKWGFPNLNDGVNSISDTITQTIQIIEYVGLFGMIAYPIIFYKDTISFFKEIVKLYKLPVYVGKFFLSILLLPWYLVSNTNKVKHFLQEFINLFSNSRNESNYFSAMGKKIEKKAKTFFKDITTSEGFAITLFTVVIAAIEIAISFLAQILGLFLYFIAFIILVSVVNKIITSKYGQMSYTAMFSNLAQSALELSEPLIPDLERQIEIIERKERQKQKIGITLGTSLPILIYYLIAYITTAISVTTPVWTSIFLLGVVPLSIGIISFSISLFVIKNPIMRELYSYPLKAVSVIGFFIYYGIALNRLIYNEIGTFPIFAIFYLPLIYLNYRLKKGTSELLLLLAGEYRERALKELIMREEINFAQILEHLYLAPSFLKFWLIIILMKRKKSGLSENLVSLLKSEYSYDKMFSALILLYLNDETHRHELIRMLEEDPDSNVREAIAYGLRYLKDLEDTNYKRVIDAQHYEDNAKVLKRLKETISILDQRYMKKEETEEVLVELE